MRPEALRALDRRLDKVRSLIAASTREADTAADVLVRGHAPAQHDQLETKLYEAVVWDLPGLASVMVSVQEEIADFERQAGIVTEGPTPSILSRCQALAQAISRLQRHAVYTKEVIARRPDVWNLEMNALESDAAHRAAIAAEAALARLEQCIAGAEADLLVLTASRAPDHEALSREEGVSGVEHRPSWGESVTDSEAVLPPLPAKETSQTWSRFVAQCRNWIRRWAPSPKRAA